MVKKQNLLLLCLNRIKINEGDALSLWISRFADPGFMDLHSEKQKVKRTVNDLSSLKSKLTSIHCAVGVLPLSMLHSAQTCISISIGIDISNSIGIAHSTEKAVTMQRE